MTTPTLPALEFANPPVVETALSIQFEELVDFKSIHFGLFHQLVKDEFPQTEDRGRLAPIIERFPPVPSSGQPSLQLEHAPRPQRVWYINATNEELLQLQPDRFAFNWRKGGGNPTYPRFRTNLPRCMERFRQFQEFCRHPDYELGDVEPELVEAVYVNHLIPLDGERAIDLLANSLRGLEWSGADGFLPATPESATFNRVYRIDPGRGRLYVEATLGRSHSVGEIVHLKLTARVNHAADEGITVEDSMTLAHDWVVHGFADVTEPSIQRERWGREA